MSKKEKKQDRIDRLENTVNILLELVNNRNIIRKDADTQTTKQTMTATTHAQTETVTTTSTDCQTEFRKNITERGILVKPTLRSVSVGTERIARVDTKVHAVTQTEKVISLAEIFLRKVNTRVLPQLNAVELEWIQNEVNNQTFDNGDVPVSFQRIKARQFSTEDVVTAIVAVCQMVVATYNGDETEYETDVEDEPEQTPPAVASLYYKVRQSY